MKYAVRNASLALIAICCIAGITTAGIEVLSPGIEVLGIEVLSGGELLVHSHVTNAPEGAFLKAYRAGVLVDMQMVGDDGYASVVFPDAHPDNELALETAEGIEVLRINLASGIEVLSTGTGLIELD